MSSAYSPSQQQSPIWPLPFSGRTSQVYPPLVFLLPSLFLPPSPPITLYLIPFSGFLGGSHALVLGILSVGHRCLIGDHRACEENSGGP